MTRRCSLKCSMYLFYVFLHIFHVFYMYFFKCSIYFYVFLHSFHVQCILYVFLHMLKYFHVFLNSFHFFYVFLHMFHVFFMCSFTDSMCFLTCSQKLAKAFRCHSYSKTIIWTVPETTIYPVIFVLYSSSITACSEKKKKKAVATWLNIQLRWTFW